MTRSPLNPAIWLGERTTSPSIPPPPRGHNSIHQQHTAVALAAFTNPRRFRPMDEETSSPSLKASATYLARASDCVPYRNGAPLSLRSHPSRSHGTETARKKEWNCLSAGPGIFASRFSPPVEGDTFPLERHDF